MARRGQRARKDRPRNRPRPKGPSFDGFAALAKGIPLSELRCEIHPTERVLELIEYAGDLNRYESFVLQLERLQCQA